MLDNVMKFISNELFIDPLIKQNMKISYQIINVFIKANSSYIFFMKPIYQRLL